MLLEESILGWKEYELEMMRDKNDNVVVVCSIENFDPVGVHTGDSITVAPALTLTDREYQRLRDISIAVIREVGVDTGGCNIQFAIEPDTGRVVVIEMNPRVSRSSALASKATGFAIAKIATKLSLGYTLDEIPNDITQKTPASFEPTLDYVVVKVPRFAFEKFPAADHTLTTTMKSVGEAMAMGRNFTEALQKALRSLEQKGSQLDFSSVPEWEVPELIEKAKRPTTDRLHQVQRALLGGATVEQLFEATKIDPWFLDQLQLLNEISHEIRKAGALTVEMLQRAKRHGFSDEQIGALTHNSEAVVRGVRQALGIRPVYKTVDTCAAEFAAYTPYHYSSYDEEDEVALHSKPSIIILGSGPNRIGQGIEFDYSCVHASMALRKAGYETVMVNCNPETVSTDYDVSTRLYFEPLTLEDVLEVIAAEERTGGVMGVFVQLGGQTPLKLAQQLADAGVPDPGHLAGSDRPRRAPRRILPRPGQRRPDRPEERHRRVLRGRQEDRGRNRLPGPGPPVLRAGRPRHGNRLRRAQPLPLHRQRHRNHPGPPGADRPVPRGRRRNRRRRPLRRHGHVPRRHHGAHRGGRHPLRRLRLRAAPDHPGQQRARTRPHRNPGHRRGRGRPRPDQHPVRAGLGRALRPGSEPAGLPHRAVRLQGHRRADGQGRGPDRHRRHHQPAPHRLQDAAGDRRRLHPAARRAGLGQGSSAAVQPLPHA